ncbi:MAG: ABC transporter ATP-binding protein [Anaerolineales bacterium]
MDFAVELRAVTKTYADRLSAGRPVTAVNALSLGIRPGEFFTLLGPSGCGKTTTLRMIAGFESVTHGELLIQGQPVQHVPPNKRPVNTVFQNYALFPHLSVAGNVGFGLAVKRLAARERTDRVHEALELVRLPGLGDRRPDQLSGGQQQRVALARALVNRPAVLLLDEPLGALDLKLRKEMQLELKQLQAQVGITFIYVTHDQEEALTMSDRIAVMNRGELLQVGDPKTIYEQPATRFVADFIGESNFITGHVRTVEPGRVLISALGREMAAQVGAAAPAPGQSVTVALRPEKVTVASPSAPDDITGVIGEMIYIGTDTRLSVELASGERLVARVPNTGNRDRAQERMAWQVGDRVAVSWLPEDARVLVE